MNRSELEQSSYQERERRKGASHNNVIDRVKDLDREIARTDERICAVARESANSNFISMYDSGRKIRFFYHVAAS